MSFIAALTAAAPILIPAAIGAAGGAGLGALTSEDGFSDDGWWKGMLMGGIGGGAGGAAGLFSPAAGGGAGGLLAPSGSAAALPSSPIVSGAAMPVTDYSIFTGATPGASPLSSIMGNAPSALSQSPRLLSAAEALNPSMLKASGGLNPNFFSGSGLSNTFGGMMPSQDTLTKGLLGSMVMKNLGGSGKQQQPQRGVPLTKTQTTGLPPMRQGLPWQPSRGYQRRSLRR